MQSLGQPLIFNKIALFYLPLLSKIKNIKPTLLKGLFVSEMCLATYYTIVYSRSRTNNILYTPSPDTKINNLLFTDIYVVILFLGKSSQSSPYSFNRSNSNSRFGQEFPLLGTEKPNAGQMSYSNGLFGSSSATHASARNFPPIGTFSLDSNNVFNR